MGWAHEVKERKGEVTYLVDHQTPRNPLRVLHVNRLKPHFERSKVTILLVTEREDVSFLGTDRIYYNQQHWSKEYVMISPTFPD